MIIQLNAPIDSYIAPPDDIISVVCEAIGYIGPQMTNPVIRCLDYGFCEAKVLQALIDAKNRAVDVAGVLDDVEFNSPKEKPVVADFINKMVPGSFIPGHSYEKQQIIHSKLIWTGWAENSTPLEYKEFTNWREAAQAGYPIVIGAGSYNFTEPAKNEVNNFFVIASQQLASQYQELYVRVRQYNVEKIK